MTGLFSALLIFQVQVFNNEFILLSIEKKILKQTKANLFVTALPRHINEITFNKHISITLYIHIKIQLIFTCNIRCYTRVSSSVWYLSLLDLKCVSTGSNSNMIIWFKGLWLNYNNVIIKYSNKSPRGPCSWEFLWLFNKN